MLHKTLRNIFLCFEWVFCLLRNAEEFHMRSNPKEHFHLAFYYVHASQPNRKPYSLDSNRVYGLMVFEEHPEAEIGILQSIGTGRKKPYSMLGFLRQVL